MLALGPPADHRFLVGPGRERQDATLAAFALEALVIDKALDRLELWLQELGEIEIVVELVRLRLHLENHRKHDALSLLFRPPAVPFLLDAPFCPGAIAAQRAGWGCGIGARSLPSKKPMLSR